MVLLDQEDSLSNLSMSTLTTINNTNNNSTELNTSHSG